jgi:ferrous iron transport protein B
VSRQFILKEKPKGIINIVDATNIERNLYLTLQLLELNIPMVVALNMMDEMQGNGGSVLVNELEQYLGVPVVPISAAKNEGIHELVDHALHVAKYQERPMQQDFCRMEDHNGAVHRAIHAVMHLIEDHADKSGIPIRFAATKLIEGDPHILKELQLDENEVELLGHIVLQMEKERGLDRSAAIADMRFDYINKAVEETVIKPRESKEHERSARIDKILTGKYTAIPAFIAIMAVVFWLTFDLIGGNLQALVELGIEKITGLTEAVLTAANVNEVVCSLIINGIYNGVGTVLTALPFILTLFFCLSLLEDSGYMARIAFVMDRSMRKIGLSGRSIVPMLMGFGCSVPAIMSSRTLPSERDRRMTIMLVPFMSCTAKIPVYTFFAAAFFPQHIALVMIILYLNGIFVSIVTATIAKKTAFKGEAVPFVMELPNYRMPGAKSVCQLLWEKTKDFLNRAFTIIFMASIVVWFLQSFNTRLHLVTDIDDSILAILAGWIAPIFAPLGFGDWRISTALITGFMAKESVVSTLSVLFGSITSLQSVLSTRTAASLLVFCLLYTPCIAAIASVKRELGAKAAAFMVFFQCAVAWVCAFLVYLLGAMIW